METKNGLPSACSTVLIKLLAGKGSITYLHPTSQQSVRAKLIGVVAATVEAVLLQQYRSRRQL